MSADSRTPRSPADKLAALESTEVRGIWEGGVLLPAMPQIVAVVRAAERHIRSPGALTASQKHADLVRALDALNEVLP